MMAALYARWIAPFWLPIVIAIAIVGWGLAATFKVQIEGLKIWPIHIVGWREENGTLRLDLDKIKSAQVVAAERAAAAKAKTERQFHDAAERAEDEHRIELDQARIATAAFIARNRLRPQAAGHLSSGAVEAGQGIGPAVPYGPSESAVLVVVPERDVTNGSDNYIYAKKAYDLFQVLIAKGLAEPAKPIAEGPR